VRLWSLHPEYLDTRGLVALWREGLLARAVLRGATRGYRHHPQLERFRAQQAPISAINAYLLEVWREASRRGYAFDRRRIGPVRRPPSLSLNLGQLAYEREHLRAKLQIRAPEGLAKLPARPKAHPLFHLIPGPVATWERPG